MDRWELAEAEKLQRKVIHAVEMVQGPKSAALATATENLAATLLVAGRNDEAEDLFQRYSRILNDSNHGQTSEAFVRVFRAHSHFPIFHVRRP